MRKGQPAGCCQQKIEYYDDEELDLFIGKEADAYTEEETNQFRDVLYTMQDIDVAGWVRSLQLRGIELPDDLKDEVFLIIGERRTAGHKRPDRLHIICHRSIVAAWNLLFII